MICVGPCLPCFQICSLLQKVRKKGYGKLQYMRSQESIHDKRSYMRSGGYLHTGCRGTVRRALATAR